MSNSEVTLAGKPSVKTRYRVTNWREYDRALVEHGRIRGVLHHSLRLGNQQVPRHQSVPGAEGCVRRG